MRYGLLLIKQMMIFIMGTFVTSHKIVRKTCSCATFLNFSHVCIAAEVNEYNDGDTEVECKYDLCRCDWDAAQCIGRLKQTYSNSHYDYSDNHVCENTGQLLCLFALCVYLYVCLFPV